MTSDRHSVTSRSATSDQVQAGIACCAELGETLLEGRYSLKYTPVFRLVALVLTSGEGAALAVRYCPFCGAELPRDLEDLRYEVLEELELLPAGGLTEIDAHLLDVPAGHEFLSDQWWRVRLAADPSFFDVRVPEPATVLAPAGTETQLLVLGVSSAAGDERILVVPRTHAGDWSRTPRVVSAWCFSRGAWPAVGRDDVGAGTLLVDPIVWQGPPGPGRDDWRYAGAVGDGDIPLAPVSRRTLSGRELLDVIARTDGTM